ncbi:MAG: hypothetical protein J6R37_02420, partial [Clostridia bacterium]|nr:hypothetical protein [Clostridia bacterium]
TLFRNPDSVAALKKHEQGLVPVSCFLFGGRGGIRKEQSDGIVSVSERHKNVCASCLCIAFGASNNKQ